MEFGFGVPTRGPMATPESMATLAREGENLGFAILSVSDHVIIPKAIASTYPYNESDSFVSSPSGERLEQLSGRTLPSGPDVSAGRSSAPGVLAQRPTTAGSPPMSSISVNP